MKKVYFSFIFISFFLPVLVFAQEPVVFPVEELGGCRNFRECADFCDRPENFKICNDFAQTHGMVTPEQGGRARKMLEAAEMGGPGGCRGQGECEVYCRIPGNIEECIIFAKAHDLIPPEELKEAEKALAAIKKGFKPPPCGGKKECDIYCFQPEHIEECLDFGEAAGFISPEEAEMARKTGGKGPGGCRGKEQCDAYCQDPANMEECINFGLEYGLIPPEEIENVHKTLEALKKGVKPPPCRGKEECDVYCSQPENARACIDFAVAAGFISPEEAEQAKKMAELGLTSGPGGCKGKEECEAYCDNPDNMLECVEFGEKAGFITPEQAQEARKMADLGVSGGPGGCKSPEECKTYCDDPNNMQECMEFGEKMGIVRPGEVERAKEMMMGGPGGCRTQEECEAYCREPDHIEECLNFNVEKGFMSLEETQQIRERMEMPPPEMGPPAGMPPSEGIPSEGMIPPGMPCTSFEECQQYCFQNPTDSFCQTMIPQVPLPPSEIIPTPETPQPIPIESPQTLFDIFKFLASIAIPFLK